MLFLKRMSDVFDGEARAASQKIQSICPHRKFKSSSEDKISFGDTCSFRRAPRWHEGFTDEKRAKRNWPSRTCITMLARCSTRR